MIQNSLHRDYTLNSANRLLYRLVYEAGDKFIAQYLKKYSSNETDNDFNLRANLTYVPAHAKKVLLDIRNAIFNRMPDVVREPRYTRNVDELRLLDINTFIGFKVIPELLAMGKVGVYVDAPNVSATATKADTVGLGPYMYVYQDEDILNWHYTDGQLDTVLLRGCVYAKDEYGFDTLTPKTEYRLFKLISGTGVKVTRYVDDKMTVTFLELPKIPFTIFQLSQSLLADISKHQIALLNIASSDLNYVLKSNFPFYTEQVDMRAMNNWMRPASTEEQITVEQDTERNEAKIQVGSMHGRQYGIGTDRPGFIHPSSEPLVISMKKQDAIKAEINELINLNLSSLEPQHASADSKRIDQTSKEEGLAIIGQVLQSGENELAMIWGSYDKGSSPTSILYPKNYSLRTDAERRAEATELDELEQSVSSTTFKKEVQKRKAAILLSHHVKPEIMDNITEEIDSLTVVVTDPEIIVADHEAGFVSTELASNLRGYPKGQVAQAKKDHAERLARIQMAQTDPGARGNGDASLNPNAGDDEKTISQSADTSDNGKSKTRGKA